MSHWGICVKSLNYPELGSSWFLRVSHKKRTSPGAALKGIEEASLAQAQGPLPLLFCSRTPSSSPLSLWACTRVLNPAASTFGEQEGSSPTNPQGEEALQVSWNMAHQVQLHPAGLRPMPGCRSLLSYSQRKFPRQGGSGAV